MHESKKLFILVFGVLLLGLQISLSGCTATTGSSAAGTSSGGYIYNDDY